MRRLWESPTVRSMVVYGTSGVGFAGANLILARFLPTEQYAVLAKKQAPDRLGNHQYDRTLRPALRG